MIEPTLEKKLQAWFSNLRPEERGKIDADYADQYDGSFYRGIAEEAIEWLEENGHGGFEQFTTEEMENIELYRELAAGMADDELTFDDPACVSLGDDPGAWVQGWVWVPNVRTIQVNILADDNPENPSDTDGWTLYSFNSRHVSFKHPNEFDSKEIKAKIKAGHAYRLGYYEHGQCSWFLQGEGGAGSNCPFDGVEYAGLLIWESGDFGDWPFKDQEAAHDSARSFCEIYTNWSNGQVYGYELESAPGYEGGCCFGFYSAEAVAGAIIDELPVGCDVKVACTFADCVADDVRDEIEKQRKDGE